MLEELVRFATRVARTMSRDPEVDSLANVAAWQAWLDFDPSRGVPIERWVALKTRQYVWNYWRERSVRREVTKQELWWEGVYRIEPESNDDPTVDPDDWQLLVENHLDGRSHWDMAHRRGTTVYAVRKSLRAAEARLRAALQVHP